MRASLMGMLGVVTLLAACSGGPPKGTGFTGIGTEASDAATRQYQDAEYSYQPSSSERVAVYRNPDSSLRETYEYNGSGVRVPNGVDLNGVPLTAITSRSKQMPTQAAQVLASGRAAAAHASSRWGSKYTVPLEIGDSSARLKAVTKDGLTFGVVGKIKSPFFSGQGDNADLTNSTIAAVTQRTGCGYGGNIVTQKDQYATIHRFAVLLNC